MKPDKNAGSKTKFEQHLDAEIAYHEAQLKQMAHFLDVISPAGGRNDFSS